MKILGLHGYGTNGECLRAQFLPTFNKMGGEHELVMLEGEMIVGKSVYTGAFDPPFLAYYEDVASASTRDAHKMIDEIIETDGPFDGIMGFSQGAGLALAYLLNQRITKPNEPSPFKFALFFSTNFMVSPDPDFKSQEISTIFSYDVFNDKELQDFHALISNVTTTRKDLETFPAMERLDAKHRNILREFAWQSCCVFQTRARLDIHDKNDYLEQLLNHTLPRERCPRFLNPVYIDERINIPTVHCWGRTDSDALKHLSILGKELCSERNRVVVEHLGRHELPTRHEDTKAVANAIEKAFYIGQQQTAIV